MPITVKRGLIQGTETTQGAFVQFNEAVIRFWVRDLTFTAALESVETRIQEAIDYVLTQPNVLEHPTVAGELPLQRARGKLVGTTVAIVDLIYGVTTTGGFSPQPTTTIGRFRTAFEPIEIYTSGLNENAAPVYDPFSGMPGPFEPGLADPINWHRNSEFLLTSEGIRPFHWIWQRPVMRFFISTTLTFNPVINHAVVLNRLSKVNSGTLTFRGIVFPPNTLRFDGCDVDEINVGTSTIPVFRYEVDYAFTWARRWLRQIPYFEEAGLPGTPRWVLRTHDMYERTSFTSPAFPTGSPV